MSDKKSFSIRPMYSTAELRDLLHFKSSVGAKKFLQKMNIPCESTGKKDFWLLSDIKTNCPSLFDSILESVGLNELIIKKTELEVDEAFFNDSFK